MQVAGGGAADPGGERRARPRERAPAGAGGSRARGMARWWRALPSAARRFPWPTNVLLYGALFSAGDALQQRLSGGPADWRQTRCVATVVVTFHANFNYGWQRLLERALPGRTPRAVLAKVLCDQAIAGPVAVTAFYTGEMPGRGSGGRSWGWGAGARLGGMEAGAWTEGYNPWWEDRSSGLGRGLEVKVQGPRSLGTRGEGGPRRSWAMAGEATDYGTNVQWVRDQGDRERS